jgi:nicotinamide phosphoribosyltransferase
VITETARYLKPEIMARGGKVVFRPDSGDPVKIITGDWDRDSATPEYKGAVECLWDIFGGTITDKGYKVLDPHVGLIYGDSITLERAEAILARLLSKGFASSNIVFGIGSFTYQHVTRDTLGQAIKATHGQVYGETRDLFKKPKTDSGLKNSLCGLIRVEREHGHFVAYDKQSHYNELHGLLTTVFLDGSIEKNEGITDIRKRLMEG